MIRNELEDQIRETLLRDLYFEEAKELIAQGRTTYLKFYKTMLAKAHQSKYTIHPGTTKMYQDQKRNFWWFGMKVDIAKICEQVSSMPKGKDRTLETCQNVTTLRDP